MPRLHLPRPLRIVRAAPAVLLVLPVPQCVKRPLPARSRDVQALATLQIAARRQHVHVHPAPRAPVLHRRPGVAVRLQARPGRLLELLQHLVDLGLAGLVLRRPGDHPRRVLVLELKGVRYRGHVMRIPPQNLHSLSKLPAPVPLSQHVVGGSRRRPSPNGLELNVHRPSPLAKERPAHAGRRPAGR